MKIGNLEFKNYAAKKPVSLSPSGNFLTAKEVVEQPAMTLGSLHSLSKEDQIKLAVERYSFEPDFTLAIIQQGLIKKDEIIDQIKKQTDFGKIALQAEMQYCNELITALGSGVVTTWPQIPETPLPNIPDWKPFKKKCINLKLQTRALFCENTTDSVTSPFAQYRIQNVHPVFSSRGFVVTVLQGTEDVNTNFIPQAKNSLTVYLSGIGHGSYTTYTGHGGNHILEACQYDSSVVKGKAIHFLSCQTATKLGPDTIAKGAKCYAGYIENFVLQWDSPNTPAVNELLLFAKSDSTFDIMMANGATAQQAFNATIQAFNAAISSVPNTVTATYLTLDRDRLKLHGDPNTKILPYRYVKICYPINALEKETILAQAGELVD